MHLMQLSTNLPSGTNACPTDYERAVVVDA
jgi:hypothetical protein